MPAPDPRTWAPGDALTATRLNTEVRDVLRYLLTGGPRVRVRASAAQSCASNSWTALLMGAEDWDSDGMHTGNDAHITAVTPGLYLVSAGVSFASRAVPANASLGQYGLHLTLSSAGSSTWANVPGRASLPNTSNGSTATTTGNLDLTLTRQVYLGAGDKLRAETYHIAGTAQQTIISSDTTPFLEASWVGV